MYRDPNKNDGKTSTLIEISRKNRNTANSKVAIFFITFQGSLYTSDFHFLNLGLFKLACSRLGLVSHHTTTPVLSDLIKPLIEVGFNSLTEVSEVVLVFWSHSSKA